MTATIFCISTLKAMRRQASSTLGNKKGPPMKVNGTQGLIVFLLVVATFGSLHLLAASLPESHYAKIWFGLGF